MAKWQGAAYTTGTHNLGFLPAGEDKKIWLFFILSQNFRESEKQRGKSSFCWFASQNGHNRQSWAMCSQVLPLGCTRGAWSQVLGSPATFLGSLGAGSEVEQLEIQPSLLGDTGI